MLRGAVLICLAALTLAFANSAILAAWQPNGQAVCTAANDQQFAVVCSDGAGGAFIVWQDARGGGLDICMQRLNAAGNPLWIVDGVTICGAGGNQEFPAVCSDGAGGALVSWCDARSGNWDVYAQRVDGAGNAQWTPNGVAVCTAAGSQGYPTWYYYRGYRVMVPDGFGGAIMAWHDSRYGLYRIFAQRLDSAGSAMWAPNGVQLAQHLSDNLYRPVVVADGTGGAIVTYNNGFHADPAADLWVQRVNAAGSPLWGPGGLAVCTAPNYQAYPDIVSDGAGGAILAWIDGRVGGYYEDNIWAQRVNAAGTPLWMPNGIPIATAPGDDGWPQLLADGAGGAFISWLDGRDGCIYMQRVDTAGNILWPVNGVGLAPTAAHTQGAHGLVSDGAGGAIVAWSHNPVGTTEADIHAQRIDGSGVVQWGASGVTVCAVPYYQHTNRSCSMVSDGAGGMIVAWSDERTGTNYDIYAQRLTHDGTFPVILALDIKPRSCPNPLNVKWFQNTGNDHGNGFSKPKKGGVLPMAVIGDATYDVTEIDASTLTLLGLQPLRHSYEDVSRPAISPSECACTSGGADGYMDLSLKFSKRDLVEAIGTVVEGEVIPLTVTGEMLDGTPFSATDCVVILSKEEDPPDITDNSVLHAAIPNPFNPVTRLSYDLAAAGFVDLSVYDLRGHLVERLVATRQSAGEYSVEWNATGMPSGVYFYRLRVGDFEETRKLILLK